jgi:hypothetical protein
MDKIWISDNTREDRIIAIGNNMLYKVNPKEERVHEYKEKLKNDNIPKEVLSIPYSYIKFIQYQEGKKYIQVFFGQESEEHFRINEETKLFEIFKYFETNIPDTKYNFNQYSAIQSAKKPLIAAFIVAVIFLWALYLALQMKLGYSYELVGSGRSITSIIFAIANLGISKLLLLFGILESIAFISIFKKMKNRPSVHVLLFQR